MECLYDVMSYCICIRSPYPQTITTIYNMMDMRSNNNQILKSRIYYNDNNDDDDVKFSVFVVSQVVNVKCQ